MTTQRTALYEEHEKLGAKFVPFAGWDMPVRYSGIVPEHLHVRESAGLFDVSHMGELFVTGPEAQQLLQFVACNDVSKLSRGKAQYSALLNDAGGVIDDIIIYCLAENEYLVCVNASNSDRDFEWITERGSQFDAVVENRSSEYSLLALQGPLALEVLKRVVGFDAGAILKRFELAQTEIVGSGVIVARTGYTGEDGVELFLPNTIAARVWQMLVQEPEVLPIGLGARDSLRLEAGYPLHGHELSEKIPALDSGLAWIVKFAKGDFVGRDALLSYKESGIKNVLLPFELLEKGVAREETAVVNADGKRVGVVTSGTITPTLNKPIGFCIIESSYKSEESKIFAEVRGKKIPLKLHKQALYKREMP